MISKYCQRLNVPHVLYNKSDELFALPLDIKSPNATSVTLEMVLHKRPFVDEGAHTQTRIIHTRIFTHTALGV